MATNHSFQSWWAENNLTAYNLSYFEADDVQQQKIMSSAEEIVWMQEIYGYRRELNDEAYIYCICGFFSPDSLAFHHQTNNNNKRTN